MDDYGKPPTTWQSEVDALRHRVSKLEREIDDLFRIISRLGDANTKAR